MYFSLAPTLFSLLSWKWKYIYWYHSPAAAVCFCISKQLCYVHGKIIWFLQLSVLFDTTTNAFIWVEIEISRHDNYLNSNFTKKGVNFSLKKLFWPKKPWLWRKKEPTKLKVKWKRGPSCQRVKFIARERVLAHKKFVKIFIFHSPFCTLAHSSLKSNVPHTVNLLLAAAATAKYTYISSTIFDNCLHISRKPEIANSLSLFIFFSSENEYLRATLLHDEIPLVLFFWATSALSMLAKKKKIKNLLKNSPQNFFFVRFKMAISTLAGWLVAKKCCIKKEIEKI